MMKKSHQSQKGFTLIETMVAISILSLSVASAFAAVQSSLSNLIYSKDRVVAFYLLQEATEYVRNVRDTNLIWSADSQIEGGLPRDWLYGLSAQSSDPCYFGKVCQIDSPLNVVTTCSGGAGSCDYLRQDPVSNLFGYTASWTQTGYRREISFSSMSPQEAVVTVSITWRTGSKTKTIQVEQLLFNKM